MHGSGTGQQGSAMEIYGGVRRYYVVEALASQGSILLLNCIFFFTHQQFHWSVTQNLLLASGQGVFYVAGALSAGAISGRIGRRKMLLGVQAVLLALAMVALLLPRPTVVPCVLLVYTAFSAAGWPALESLISDDAGGVVLSKRLGMYNLVWSANNAVVLALSGAVIQRWPNGVFALAVTSHAGAIIVLRLFRVPSVNEERVASSPPTIEMDETEREVLRSQRTQALWLSRIALPSTYVVVYSLAAMLPSLQVMSALSTQWRTLAGSAWFMARFGVFVALGATTFWHTRPRLMLAAAAVMLPAFLGTTLRPSDLFPAAHVPLAIDLFSMILWQLLLGAAMGIIYAASLYFGMALSEGSTEHGGYHEALIGVGSITGPAAAAVAGMVWPGQLGPEIAAVAGLIALSCTAAGVAAVGVRKPSGRNGFAK
jgi:MFS family permease